QALVHGMSGVAIATVLFALEPVPEPAEPDDDWIPSSEPSGTTLLAKGAEDLVNAPLRAARRLEQAVERPGAAVRQAGQALEGVGEIGWAFANPAPRVPLNVEIGSHRRYVWVRSDLAGLEKVKDAPGGAVNDVVLALAAR